MALSTSATVRELMPRIASQKVAESSADREQVRARLGFSGKSVFLHVGHPTAGRNLTALQALGSEASVLCLVLSDFSAFEDGAVPVGPGIHSVTGYQPDLALFYLAADVLVFPTVDSRAVVGTPLSIFEALANGTPVVARRSPATARWDGIPGLRLVDTDTELIEVARDVAREGGRVPALAIASRCGGDVTPCCSSEQK